MFDAQLAPDEVLRPLLERVTDSFLNGAPTLRVEFRSWLHSNGNRIDDLIRIKLLEYPDANHVLPGLLTFEYISPAVRILGRQGTDFVLQTLRNLYLHDLTKAGIRMDALSTTLRNEHTCDDRTLRAGIWLATHVGLNLIGTSPWGENWATLPELIHVREELLDYTTIDTSWTAAVARLYAAAAGQGSIAVESFGFITDATLRSICNRDYADLIQLQGRGMTKPRLLLAGSIIEAVLLDRLLPHEAQIRKPKPLREQTLGQLLGTAKEYGVIDAHLEHLIQAVKDYRNLNHPGFEQRTTVRVADAEATIAAQIVAILARNRPLNSVDGVDIPVVSDAPFRLTSAINNPGVTYSVSLAIQSTTVLPIAPVFATLKYWATDGTLALEIRGRWGYDSPGPAFTNGSSNTIGLVYFQTDNDRPFSILGDTTHVQDLLSNPTTGYELPRQDYSVQLTLTWPTGMHTWTIHLAYDPSSQTVAANITE